jgi:hypothetical protein
MSLDNDAGVPKCVCLCGTVAVRFGSLYRARYYNPLLQRFISEDPIRFQEDEPILMSTPLTTNK